MKKIFIVIFLVVSKFIFSNEIVNIWADNNKDYLGVSFERVWLKSYFLSNFEFYSTLNTDTKDGVLTAVTASRDLYFLLEDIFKFENRYEKDSIIITKESNIYTFIDNSKHLNFSFSLEKPNDFVLGIINMVYENDQKTGKIVRDHYLESWVIRIYSAANVINPDFNTLDFDDILITATIIGEKSQWLWGIHDGVDYIYSRIK